MKRDYIEIVFLVITLIFAALVCFFPRTFVYLFSYGNRMSYSPNRTLFIIVRVISFVVLISVALIFLGLR